MSDPLSSSPSGRVIKASDTSSPATSPAGIAFLVHSPDTLQRNLPPDVDNKPLARQKRRRTSPEDQKVLEMEYQRNPKPDKAARMEIVNRVALGEKEVQIWFQNRRQNSRRKSRPLERYEILPHLMPKGAGFSYFSASEQIDQTEMLSSEDAELQPSSPSQDPRAIADQQPEPLLLEGIENEAGELSPFPSNQEALDEETNDSAVNTRPQTVEQETGDAAPTDIGGSQVLPSSQETQRSGVGYLANRRSASFFKTHEELIAEKAKAFESNESEQKPARALRKTHSFVRLSMTEDGKARVISNADQSPSPPRSQPTPITATVDERPSGLRRSYSAVGLTEKFRQAQGQSAKQGLQRSLSGRSRDSRAWEFWCDSDARNSLTEKANQEGSGSAADAIGLIRSTSRGILRPNQNKRNAQILAQSSAKRAKTDTKALPRPPLSRSSSSFGRLQTKTTTSSTKKGKQSDIDGFEVPYTESDKENWEPAQSSASTRRSKPSQKNLGATPRRRALGENTQVLSQNNSLGAMMAREKRQNAGGKGPLASTKAVNPEDDEEIAAFMGSGGGASGRTSVSSGEELGCVQGLLKLSQANWR